MSVALLLEAATKDDLVAIVVGFVAIIILWGWLILSRLAEIKKLLEKRQ